jgi:hypothetical protein
MHTYPQPMDFPQVRAAVQVVTANAHDAQRVCEALLPNLSLWCPCDADALRMLSTIFPGKIADMSGLDLQSSQRLKDACASQVQSDGERPVPDEVIPSDPGDRLIYLLEKEGFKVREQRLPCA